MLNKSKSLLIVAALATVVSVTPTLAAEGRIPVWQPTALVGPGIDGDYILTRNITAAGAPAIVIAGSGFDEISIDLNGFTVFGDPGGAFNIIHCSSVRTLTVRNGILRGLAPGGAGLFVSGASKVVAEDLQIEDGSYGINLKEVLSFQIRHNTIVAPDSRGIYIDGSNTDIPTTGTIEGNVVRDAGENGIIVTAESSAVAIVHNRVDRTLDGVGISIVGDDCLVAENTVEHAGLDGIYVWSDGCKIHNNVAVGNACDGMIITGASPLVSDNVASQNGQNGIHGTARSGHFNGNVMVENSCFGLYFTGRTNSYGRNTARANLGVVDPRCPNAQCNLNQCLNPSTPQNCWPATTGPPAGPGNLVPDFCDGSAVAWPNQSFCDNLMPGPPPS